MNFSRSTQLQVHKRLAIVQHIAMNLYNIIPIFLVDVKNVVWEVTPC